MATERFENKRFENNDEIEMHEKCKKIAEKVVEFFITETYEEEPFLTEIHNGVIREYQIANSEHCDFEREKGLLREILKAIINRSLDIYCMQNYDSDFSERMETMLDTSDYDDSIAENLAREFVCGVFDVLFNISKEETENFVEDLMKIKMYVA